MVKRFVQRDALELTRATRADSSQGMPQAVGMVGALDLADAAAAGMERRQVRSPARGIGRDLDDAVVDDMRVDHATATAIVTAGAGHDRFIGPAGAPRLLVDGLIQHGFTSRIIAG